MKRVREATLTDAVGIAQVHVDTWRTTYPGIVSDEVLTGLSYGRSEQGWRSALEDRDRRQYVYVAEDDDGRAIGFVAAGQIRDQIEGYEGEIYAIYVLKQHQGEGLGRQLMQKAAERLEAEGFSSMMLWVLAENPTRQFYEAMGGLQIAEKEIEIGGQSLPEVGYGWASLDALLGPIERR